MSATTPIVRCATRRRTSHACWATASLVLLSALTSSAAPPPDPLGNLIQMGDDEGRLEDAVRRFDHLQRVLAEWDVDQAAALERAGDPQLAAMKREQALERLAHARRAYEYAVERYGSNARLINDYGELLCDAFGETERAVDLWQSAKRLDPNLSAAYNNLAIHFCHEGKYRIGIKHYWRALELDPDNPDFLFNLAQTYLIHGPQVREITQWSDQRLYAEAMRLSKRAAHIAPDEFPIVRDYAMNFFVAERFNVSADWRQAADAWHAARQLASSTEDIFNTWLYEARASIRCADLERAETCLGKALALHPDSPVAQTLLDGVRTKRTP